MNDQWSYYQDRIESLARRLGMAEGVLRVVLEELPESDSLRGYIEDALDRIKAQEIKR